MKYLSIILFLIPTLSFSADGCPCQGSNIHHLGEQGEFVCSDGSSAPGLKERAGGCTDTDCNETTRLTVGEFSLCKYNDSGVNMPTPATSSSPGSTAKPTESTDLSDHPHQ